MVMPICVYDHALSDLVWILIYRIWCVIVIADTNLSIWNLFLLKIKQQNSLTFQGSSCNIRRFKPKKKEKGK